MRLGERRGFVIVGHGKAPWAEAIYPLASLSLISDHSTASLVVLPLDSSIGSSMLKPCSSMAFVSGAIGPEQISIPTSLVKRVNSEDEVAFVREVPYVQETFTLRALRAKPLENKLRLRNSTPILRRRIQF